MKSSRRLQRLQKQTMQPCSFSTKVHAVFIQAAPSHTLMLMGKRKRQLRTRGTNTTQESSREVPSLFSHALPPFLTTSPPAGRSPELPLVLPSWPLTSTAVSKGLLASHSRSPVCHHIHTFPFLKQSFSDLHISAEWLWRQTPCFKGRASRTVYQSLHNSCQDTRNFHTLLGHHLQKKLGEIQYKILSCHIKQKLEEWYEWCA